MEEFPSLPPPPRRGAARGSLNGGHELISGTSKQA